MTAGDAEWAKRRRSYCGYVTVLCVSESNSGCIPTRSSPQTQGGVWKLITGRKAEISIQRMNNSSSVTRSPDKEPPGGNERRRSRRRRESGRCTNFANQWIYLTTNSFLVILWECRPSHWYQINRQLALLRPIAVQFALKRQEGTGGDSVQL